MNGQERLLRRKGGGQNSLGGFYCGGEGDTAIRGGGKPCDLGVKGCDLGKQGGSGNVLYQNV